MTEQQAVASFDVIAFGRVSMDLYPQQHGPFADATTFARSLGGSAANVAVAASRLGRSAALVSGVGADRPGAYVRGALRGFGVDDRWVTTHATLHTPLVLAELDPADDPGLEFYRAPSAPDLHLNLDLPGLRDSIVAGGVLWITGTGLSVNESFGPTVDAMKLRRAARARDHIRADVHADTNANNHADGAHAHAHAHAHLTVFDLDWRPSLWPMGSNPRAKYQRAIEQADVVVGNRAEVAAALNLGDVDARDYHAAAELLLESGVDVAIIKLGAEGVYVGTAAGSFELIGATPVDVVCGLGAGDAFGGALCDGLLAGDHITDVVARASAAGAYVAARLACADAMPSRAELDDFITRARGHEHA